MAAMTVVVTRDVDDRYRGFLCSVMVEIAPCVYVTNHLNKRSREHVQQVRRDWHALLQRGSICMAWQDPTAPTGLQVWSVGLPPRTPLLLDATLITRRRNPA